MTPTPQNEIVRFLSAPETHGGAPVERIDTHGAMVFLAGGRALKLKRAVQYDYMDFSTAERRHTACEAEVRINRRTAPAIYRGVVAITREPGGYALGGPGAPVDWCVDMVRFDQDALLDRLAAGGTLDVALMRSLAAAVADFHLAAERRTDHGGRAGMEWVVEGNAAGFADKGRGVLDPDRCMALNERALATLAALGDLLDRRRAGGFVRQCHGDLHLRNIVLLEGRPTPFDAVEFNDEIACIDVWYDVAFLLMDLWRRGLPAHANAVLNGYHARTGDTAGLAALPFFLSCRAAVRAKTSATAAGLTDMPARRAELAGQAREYLDLASRLLRPARPRLCAIGGFSGTGKSTLARALAPGVGREPGAVILRTDEIRKALCGAEELDRLGPEAYTTAMSRMVYRRLCGQAAAVLATGQSVIADGVFAGAADRAAIEAVAAASGVPFAGVWLSAPPDVLSTRVAHRPPDASDADARVVALQVGLGAGPLDWCSVDAAPPLEVVLGEVRAHAGGVEVPVAGARGRTGT